MVLVYTHILLTLQDAPSSSLKDYILLVEKAVKERGKYNDPDGSSLPSNLKSAIFVKP